MNQDFHDVPFPEGTQPNPDYYAKCERCGGERWEHHSFEPAPATAGEWTAATINTQVGYDADRQGERETIARFHNAALAAERENNRVLADQFDRYITRIDNLNKQLDAAVEALEPLAKIGRIFSVEPYALDYPDDLCITRNEIVRSHTFITIGDCRKAAALAKIREGK